MRPSSSTALEFGLERSVPRGHDLFTFVTSAAVHMMRTLQRPKKNRPSKRQVNHRRFLHNMIQRKFSEIEAANRRLASVLFSTEEVKTFPVSPSQLPETPDQLDSVARDTFQHDTSTNKDCCPPADMISTSKSGTGLPSCSNKTESSRLKQPELRHLCEPILNTYMDHSTGYTSGRTEQAEGTYKETLPRGGGPIQLPLSSAEQPDFYHKGELFQPDCHPEETPGDTPDNLAGGGLYGWIESVKEQQNAPLAHDSNSHSSTAHVGQNLECDLTIQMFTDVASCNQTKASIAEVVQSQELDTMDLLMSDMDGDLEGCIDAEVHSESFWDYQEDAGGRDGYDVIDEVTFLNQAMGYMKEKKIHSTNGIEAQLGGTDFEEEVNGYRQRYGWYGHQGLTAGAFTSGQGFSPDVEVPESRKETETEVVSFRLIPEVNISTNQPPTSMSYHYESSGHQCDQQESSFMLLNNCSHHNCAPFQGVAQSFSAPPQNPQYQLLLTPPLEDDWLFTDILEDRISAQC